MATSSRSGTRGDEEAELEGHNISSTLGARDSGTGDNSDVVESTSGSEAATSRHKQACIHHNNQRAAALVESILEVYTTQASWEAFCEEVDFFQVGPS